MPTNWGRQEPEQFDKYRLYEAFLWGAVQQLHPSRKVKRPVHAVLASEFDAGVEIARGGYINLRPDADPSEIARRRKREHRLRAAGAGVYAQQS